MCNICNSCGNCRGLSNSSTNNGCGCCGGRSNTSANNGCGGCGLFCVNQRICRDGNGNIRISNNECGCNFCNCRTGFGSCVNTMVASDFANGVRATVTVNDTESSEDYYVRQYALNGRNNRSNCDCRCNNGSTNRLYNRCGCGCG